MSKAVHGDDHLPGRVDETHRLITSADDSVGIDTSDGAWDLSARGRSLPPWVEYDETTLDFPDSHFIGIQSTSNGDSVPPDVHIDSAWIMVQTEEGTTAADGGTPLDNGTVLGQMKVHISGSPGDAGTGTGNTGEYFLPCFPLLGALNTSVLGVIGHGYIQQGTSFYSVEVLNDGRILAPAGSDPSPPGTAQNTVRVDWPWAWDTGDIIAVSFQYPIGE